MNSKPALASQALQLDRQLCFALYSSSLAMTKLYKPLLAEIGLTYPQYLVMLVLWEGADDGEALTVSALGERLFLDSGTLTPLLKRLEATGLLTRTRAAADERRVLIELTPAGRALKKKAATIPQCLLQTLDCSVVEVAALTQQLQALRQRLLVAP